MPLVVEKVKKFFEQGSWGVVEKELAKAEDIIWSDWYIDFIKKKVKAYGGRFIGDGLCGKYGHEMIQVKICMA